MAIMKASEFVPHTLIMSKPGGGSTTEAVKRARDIGGSVLVVTFGSPARYAEIAPDFDVYHATSLKQYVAEILAPLRQGNLKYDVIIHEKLNAHLSLVIGEYGDQPRQQDWGAISNTMYQHILTEQSYCKGLIVTTDLAPDEEGVYRIPMNRHTTNKILPLFSHKVFCYARPIYNEEDEIVGSEYQTQSNPALALAFIEGIKDA